MIGLTSISFRNLSWQEIIEISKENGINMIEWGGDIHVPPGDLTKAKEVGIATRKQGIQTLSYGSYYHLLENKNIKESFSQVLATAEALGAQIIRIWTSKTKGITDLNQMCQANIRELKIICQMAAKTNMKIGLEYHRGTLTETKEMTLKILQTTNMPNLFTYWQLNPDISHQERLAEIQQLKNHICNVHVFYWEPGKDQDIRRPLSHGRKYWHEYWALLKDQNCPLTLEFVKDNQITQLKQDIKELKYLTR